MLEIDDSEKPKLVHEETTSTIIGAAFEVRAQLGYGFRERVYQSPLPAELRWRGATAELEKRVQVPYKGVIVEDDDVDVLVDNSVAVEIKVAAQYDKREEAQLLNELKATRWQDRMLVNFGRTKVEYKRLVF
jgi:GxxExxY protein